ncbi:nuclear transport factor 2 family protein [Sphingopyxis macrogoltabida]|uniref:nuclear transport factor 2 family protein n=1 Tax=Sphingopyxis macrogoltabida TaxID=33050 RepID=UPI0006CAAAED|nr:nuclear transport factor 2 family protein [Sphingopyxis macrogoltabida]
MTTHIIREYYARIDRCDTDWVVDLFDDDAIYERAETVYTGRPAIARFFREERRIRGVHHIEAMVSSDDGDLVVAIGHFDGTGAAGDARNIGFADMWQFGDGGRIHLRRTFLARGSDYVRQ